MIKQTYKSLSDLKELYRDTEQDQKKLERKLARMSKGARA